MKNIKKFGFLGLAFALNAWAVGNEGALGLDVEKDSAAVASSITIIDQPAVASQVISEVTNLSEKKPTDSLANEPIVNQNPSIQARYADKKHLLLRYRQSENMPEITNSLVLEGIGDKEAMDRINQRKDKIGTIPRLVLLPCSDGCANNKDYEKVAAAFQERYAAPVQAGLYEFRGQIKVKVRWYQERGMFERMSPIPTRKDVFAISFPLEGKLITLSSYSIAKKNEMSTFVTKTSGLLNTALGIEMGAGVKPYLLQFLLPENERSLMVKVNDGLAPIVKGIDKIFGGVDYSSRIEPMTSADDELLPAVDGILPNEINPLKEPVFYNHL